MTIPATDLWIYVAALVGLFLTPGPVWVALLARALAGGFRSAWPLAVGVALGDILWPLLAILGLSWAVAQVAWLLVALKWMASVIFVVMGVLVIRAADDPIPVDGRLVRPGLWAGFAAGVAVIVGNPKAVFFYVTILPGFFDVTALTARDIAAICVISAAVPMIGNLAMAAVISRLRVRITTPAALRRITLVAGGMLIAVGLVLPFL